MTEQTPIRGDEAVSERERLLEKRLRDLSIMLTDHLGGGSEWFSQIGDEYYADPRSIGPELRRRKRDAQITKRALFRANPAKLTEPHP
jgi:hypothetical protein